MILNHYCPINFRCYYWLDPKEPKSQACYSNHLPKLAYAVFSILSGLKTAEHKHLKHGRIYTSEQIY